MGVWQHAILVHRASLLVPGAIAFHLLVDRDAVFIPVVDKKKQCREVERRDAIIDYSANILCHPTPPRPSFVTRLPLTGIPPA